MFILIKLLLMLALHGCAQSNFNTAPKAHNTGTKAASVEDQVQKTSPPPQSQSQSQSQPPPQSQAQPPKLETAKAATPTPEPTANRVPVYGSCTSPCSGEEVTFFNAKYRKWIKVVLCSQKRYDILMGESEAGPFYKVGDEGGHGQDHCELVNSGFSDLRSDDDVTSGNCPSCKVHSAGSVTDIPAIFGTKIFSRSRWGEQFEFRDATLRGIHTSCWYECGVTFP